MIVATHKCGCPPPSDESCLPCCASAKSREKPRDRDCPTIPYSVPRPVTPQPEIEQAPSACCPVDPCESYEEEKKDVRSEIAESGLPFKELEAVINENRLVIRTQDEPVRPEFDPPCDCVEDTLPKRKTEEIGITPAAGKRTITLYPQVKNSDPDVRERRPRAHEQAYDARPRTIDQEENPNIFLLRVKKRKTEGDKKFSVDLEFRTARPWSPAMRSVYEKLARTVEPAKVPTVQEQVKKKKKKKKSSSKQKKKK
ncbi:uncharacterized protein LOC108628703 [Ceratina calcarata]|uniref:Uncharacterized protein LOC108628703 n=1 Tax=Ceratina calcarata TaxID=156304 RepID=A0AAJ7J704_9HYME|nr:uncharacterized protein LOC108628703 [Ceratina calcarata]